VNIYWRFPASAAISAHHATRALQGIKSAWWNSGSGYAWMFSRRFPTGILLLVPFRHNGCHLTKG
jgi:hypothetical protein